MKEKAKRATRDEYETPSVSQPRRAASSSSPPLQAGLGDDGDDGDGDNDDDNCNWSARRLFPSRVLVAKLQPEADERLITTYKKPSEWAGCDGASPFCK